ncbi:Zinc finger CCHC-type protein [Dioscorea alata]|uniref:Zinc finger CCHC-type protein n=1 Tax=Dioscorea alata TaxID=55571 RepID=A0ACB7WUD5_DIOAL|nr:Zinc finger CCHC-type protein [Dioscorea alata]
MAGREGASVTRPPLLNGSNYPYWKARMRAFIKSLDESAWIAVEERWSPPTQVDEEKKEIVKKKINWSTEDMKKANANGKALNAIFGGVGENQFKYVAMCESAKEAWEILQTIHEGTNVVRTSKLQMLTTMFENLRMGEEETIAIFNAKLMDIANQAYQLGKKYSDKKLVQKTLRSLPRRFEAKVAAIEEARDITTMKLDELIGSLQAYEMNQNPERKVEDFALKIEAVKQKELQQTIVTDDEDEEDGEFVFLSKKLHNMFRKYKKKGSRFQKKEVPKEEKEEAEDHQQKIKCWECGGVGHYQLECANTLKKKGKSLNAKWSDDSDYSMDEEEEEGNCNHHISFPAIISEVACKSRNVAKSVTTSITTSDSESDEVTEKDLLMSYKLMLTKFDQMMIQNKRLEKELTECQGKLSQAEKILESMNKGKAKLDEMLSIGRPSKVKKGIGYVGETSSAKTECSRVTFVKSTAQQKEKQVKAKKERIKEVPTCFHCGEIGHIRPKCNKLKEDLKNGRVIGHVQATIKRRVRGRTTVIKKMWIRKTEVSRENVNCSTCVMIERVNQDVTTSKYNMQSLDRGPTRSTCKVS